MCRSVCEYMFLLTVCVGMWSLGCLMRLITWCCQTFGEVALEVAEAMWTGTFKRAKLTGSSNQCMRPRSDPIGLKERERPFLQVHLSTICGCMDDAVWTHT